jgi:hypothetical protein
MKSCCYFVFNHSGTSELNFFWTHSSSLRLAHNCPWTNSVTPSVILGISLYGCGTDHTENTVLLQEPLRNLATGHSLIYCYVLGRVYVAVAWQRVNQTYYNILEHTSGIVYKYVLWIAPLSSPLNSTANISLKVEQCPTHRCCKIY